MADEVQDRFDFITENCQYSSSQEELFCHATFAREDETFPDDDDSLEAEDSGVSRRELYGGDDSRRRQGVESAAGDVNCAEAKNLGFRGERKGAKEGEVWGTKLEGKSLNKGDTRAGERVIGPQLKKSRVSPRVSPLVNCSGTMVIEGEDDGEEVVVFKGDLKVEKVSSSRSVVPENVECTNKLGSESGGDGVQDEGEMLTENRAKEKLDFGGDTEVNNFAEDEEEGIGAKNVDKEGDHGEGSAKQEDEEKVGDGEIARKEEDEDITRREKRDLPRSMLGFVWGEGTGAANGNGAIANGDVVAGNGNVEGVVEEATVEGRKNEKSKGDEKEAIKSILDVLSVLLDDKSSNDDTEVDILETAKRHGMTFPRSRFLPEAEEDE